MAQRVLHILAQRPSLTGSGVTLDALVRRAHVAGWEQDVVVGVPESLDGVAEITVSGDNMCALDNGPGLSADPNTGLCSGSLGAGADLFDDVWYAYTATACGTLRVTACDDACNDLIIAAYDGSGGCPVTTGDEMSCDDDGCTYRSLVPGRCQSRSADCR